MSLYRRSPIERHKRSSYQGFFWCLWHPSPLASEPTEATKRDEKRHTRNENRAGNQESWGPAFKQKLAEGPGAEAYMLRISSHKLHRSTSVVPRTPGGKRAKDNSQSQAAETERERKDETKASQESSNVRKETSIPTNSIQDKVNHPFHLQGVLKPPQAILSEAEPNHLELS